ncbi:hypothetical protein [Tsuneonella dongtanensis]|uniref:hypothetical protein n=1 Tax=Tsuneonella dongtanensis TaxID=692370 RepID=UPI0012ED9FF6|nr:hypothetical protein [Tsuneonella dongtanensis]
MTMPFVGRIAVTVGVMIAVASATAIALALYDMDRVGHGQPSFVYERLTPGMGFGDAVLIVAVALAGIAAWVVSGRG